MKFVILFSISYSRPPPPVTVPFSHVRGIPDFKALVEDRDYLPPSERKVCVSNILAGRHSISSQLGDRILTLAQGVVT